MIVRKAAARSAIGREWLSNIEIRQSRSFGAVMHF